MNRMIKTSLSASLLALFVASTASAADLGRNTSDPTSAEYVAPDKVSFTGFYVGGRIGYGNANHDLTVERYNGAYCWDDDSFPTNFDPTSKRNKYRGDFEERNTDGSCDSDELSVDPSNRDVANIDGLNSHGIIGGFQAGYDHQFGRFVVGVFGTYDFSAMETSISEGVLGISGNGQDLSLTGIEKGDEWSIGARAGLRVNEKTLVYLLAAYTQTEYDFKGVDHDDDDKAFSKATTFDGVSVGGGVEFAVTQNIFLGLEYVHTFYGEETVLDTGPSEVGGFGQKIIDDLDEDKVMATLKVKLNSGLGF